MDSDTQELSLEPCRRPRHLLVDQWYDDSAGARGAEAWIVRKPGRRESEKSKKRKASRRMENWWHKPVDERPLAPSSEKLAEAKRRRFTAEDKDERIARSLVALYQPSQIKLTREEWRQITEDADLEDQS
jgi:hypothetical protein